MHNSTDISHRPNHRLSFTVLLIAIALLASACASQAEPADMQASESADIASPSTSDGSTTTPTTTSTEPQSSTTSGPKASTSTTAPEAVEPESEPSVPSPTNSTELAKGNVANPNNSEMQRFLSTDQDEPFYMVNLIKYRDVAMYPDGRETDLTGAEADAIYGQHVRGEALPSIGAEVVYRAEVEQDTYGASEWDVVAIVHYPSRTAFAAMTSDPEFQEMAIHKEAGVWEEVRVNTFPSHATFEALTSDTAWQSGFHHRGAALENTYGLLTLPSVNTFNGVIAN